MEAEELLSPRAALCGLLLLRRGRTLSVSPEITGDSGGSEEETLAGSSSGTRCTSPVIDRLPVRRGARPPRLWMEGSHSLPVCVQPPWWCPGSPQRPLSPPTVHPLGYPLVNPPSTWSSTRCPPSLRGTLDHIEPRVQGGFRFPQHLGDVRDSVCKVTCN